MQLECQARLAAAGFEQYEVWRMRARRCRHNLVYREYGDYFRRAAHGKLTSVTWAIALRCSPSRGLSCGASLQSVWRVRTVRFRPAADHLNALHWSWDSASPVRERTGLPSAVAGAAQAPARRIAGGGTLAATHGRQFGTIAGAFLPA
jgi:hypothetical protein